MNVDKACIQPHQENLQGDRVTEIFDGPVKETKCGKARKQRNSHNELTRLAIDPDNITSLTLPKWIIRHLITTLLNRRAREALTPMFAIHYGWP